MLIASGTVCLVESRHGSMHVDVHKNRVELVTALLRHGSFVGGGVHFGPDHVAALEHVIAYAQALVVSAKARGTRDVPPEAP